MNLWVAIFVTSMMMLGFVIGYIANKVYNRSVRLGFITTLAALIVPVCAFLIIIYFYGIYQGGHSIKFRW
ncbi:hypothetical protein ACFFJY_01445 [Fictibacillus aquaticus]|uniref:Uncharacterized protein n=1 Tax=Fictibacillus aquaticus TaxID=2021314 RepID=A0A235F7U4_9BACL|nr:hypothetical protein [Fictibacillus aquaticus]OYD57380.1 hypothetical protein CGZ90_11915 [Fictibacillus aquaticus]